MRWYPLGLLATLPLWLGGGPPGQGRERDAGTFLVTVNGADAWREEFVVRDGRSPSRDGFTVEVRRFTGDAIAPTLLASAELGPDSQPTGAEITDPGGSQRTFIQISKRRITVRGVMPGGESLREYPGADQLLLADDSLVAWFAMAQRAGAPNVTVFQPRVERSETVELVERGTETNGLRHVMIGDGPGAMHLWFDPGGRLMKVERPSAGLLAIRTTATP